MCNNNRCHCLRAVTPDQIARFAAVARRRMRGKDGGFRRDHLRALAQRVEVAEREVRIMGSRNELLRVLAAANGVGTAADGVRTYVPEWRSGRDRDRTFSNLRTLNGLGLNSYSRRNTSR